MEKLMTNVQLAMWLSLGKGQVKDTTTGLVSTSYIYAESCDENFPTNILIRPFLKGVWESPVVSIYNRDCLGL